MHPFLQSDLFVVVVVLFLSLSIANAFLPLRPASLSPFAVTTTTFLDVNNKKTIQTRRYAIFNSFEDDEDDDDIIPLDDDHFDVEVMRQRLESLLVGSSGSGGMQQDEQRQQQVQQQQQPLFPSNTNVAAAYEEKQPECPRTFMRPSTRRATNSLGATNLMLVAPHDIIIPPLPLLTTMERERRLRELQLLDQLAIGDGAVSLLWELWLNERGPDAAQKLQEAEEYADRQEYLKAELLLRALVDEYGVHWVEPVHRLASLALLQDQYEKAANLYKIVLAVKPWHFGALSALVRVLAAQNDADQAQIWALRRLPTFQRMTGGIHTNNSPTSAATDLPTASRRRLTWVAHAIASAQSVLQSAEHRMKASFFGKSDDDFKQQLCLEEQHDQLQDFFAENDHPAAAAAANDNAWQ